MLTGKNKKESPLELLIFRHFFDSSKICQRGGLNTKTCRLAGSSTDHR
jgi:hypothetical protein